MTASEGASGTLALRSIALALATVAIFGLSMNSSARAQQPASVPGRLLVKFHPNVPDSQHSEVAGAVGGQVDGALEPLGIKIVSLPPNANSAAARATLNARPEVQFAEPDYVFPVSTIPDDPFYPYAWHLPRIGCPAAWDVTVGSNDVIIAILDTGVNGTHVDLASKMVPGWNCFDDNSNTTDVYGHGTAVAGCAAASTGNGTGVAAPAIACKIMPVRISDLAGLGYSSTIAAGLIWAADHGARVANISYQVSNISTVTTAAQYFQSHGGVVTVSAGNDAWFESAADNPYVLTVSATTSVDLLASWSNTGNNIDLAAPGDGIYTTTFSGGYGVATGTSAAAPLVAAVAALVISVNPSLTPAQVQDILKQTASDLGASGWDTSYGSGLLNAAGAVSLAGTTAGGGSTIDTTPPTVAVPAPTSGATVSGTITVQVTATDNVAVSAVSLSRDGVLVGTDTSAPYSFTWNTTTVGNGGHTLTATATDLVGNSTNLPVDVTVANAVLDTTAPTISITSPANNAHVTGNVSVTVATADNVGVTKVELYVDNVKKKTSTTAPFTTVWKAANGTHTLRCKAFDAAGNTTWSAPITVIK